ncbi:hypothetical protein GCM10009557_07350 [Virgisporangium ochraceum]|uniref:Uncharacterized protein n=1 Tax=Virgisporangium ochraceum TaxID=65505 RepID=A0A8J4EHA4_9ACTN|nr:hypothetical protein [Virgisporangium ochraceum]GIJ74518.1 hypothetical protein Voc01_094350 [Virgisporangium ochraceum]
MSQAGPYAAKATTLRDQLKWVIAAFTGASATLFSGLTIANVSLVSKQDHWYVPIAFAITPLICTAVVVAIGQWVMSDPDRQLGSLFPVYGGGSPDGVLIAKIDRLAPPSVAVHGGMGPLDDVLHAAAISVDTARRAADGSRERDSDLRSVEDRLTALQQSASDAIECAAYIHVRDRYDGKLRWITALGAAAVAGVVLSALSTAIISRSAVETERRAEDDRKRSASLAPPSPAGFTTARKVRIYPVPPTATLPEGAAGPGRCTLVQSGATATAIGGTHTRPVLVFDYTADVPGAPPNCRQPWVWTPESADLLVVVPVE